MYIIRYVQDDSLKELEVIDREEANTQYKAKYNDPTVTELQAFILTIDVKFKTSSKVYTYFVDAHLKGYSKIITANGDELTIVQIKMRTPQELKAMAKSHGFSSFKVLHGTAIK